MRPEAKTTRPANGDGTVEFARDKRSGHDRRRAPTRAVLVVPHLERQATRRSLDARRDEFASLAKAINLDVRDLETLKCRTVRPATFFGQGQVEALRARVEDTEAELVIVDTALTPIQQRNLETGLKAKVLDRTALILEIFGDRAATREGVLQVELAHLNYQKSRLVRSWTHLERQRGGFGFLGGPGETQIEADRRLLQERIGALQHRIEKVRKTRAQQRRTRDAVPFPLIALVGYTNAGKSTLFNSMTGAKVGARDQLFATLDTTVRRVVLPHGREIILSDTVGFIADLPTDLVAAFRATLEEVLEADIILHVRDISGPDRDAQGRDVVDVLHTLGVHAGERPIIEVWNKIDLVSAPDDTANLPEAASDNVAIVRTSAANGNGLGDLALAIEKVLAEQSQTYAVAVPHTAGEGMAWLYAHTEVIERADPDDTATRLIVRVDNRHRATLLTRFGSAAKPVRA